MKCPALFILITFLVTFCSFASAQENQDTPSRPKMNQQKNGIPGQIESTQFTKKRKNIKQDIMRQDTMRDCTCFMINRILMGSSNFYLDMSKSLELTNDQIDMLQEIRLNYTKETIDLQGELEIARLELLDLLESDDIQINDADQYITDAYDIEEELQIIKIRSVIKARNVLTPEQREQVKSLTRSKIILPDLDGYKEHRY